jgi:hypothetical protein
MAHVFDRDDVFKYHAPSADQIPKYEAIREAGKHFCRAVEENTPRCADQSAAIRKIREAVMTANSAVALNGSV